VEGRPPVMWTPKNYPLAGPTVASDGTVRGMDSCRPLGALEIQQMLGFPYGTVRQWINRGLLPAADFGAVNGSRAWLRSTILEWAGDTGRLYQRSDLTEDQVELLRVEFRAEFGREPAPANLGGPRSAVVDVEVGELTVRPSKRSRRRKPESTPEPA
jgi:hypothetical protein